jgi:hypothetical protein
VDDRQIATELAVTQAMADQLSDYLTGREVYRQMLVETPAGVRQPVMTLGALLENLDSLGQEPGLSAAQRNQLKVIEDQVKRARRMYGAQWRAMLQRELKALLDSWKWYLDDVERDPRAKENYSSEVSKRTRIELLQHELAASSSGAGAAAADDPALSEDERRLNELDARLRSMLKGSDYAGPAGGPRGQGQKQAWWLFGRPAGEDDE